MNYLILPKGKFSFHEPSPPVQDEASKNQSKNLTSSNSSQNTENFKDFLKSRKKELLASTTEESEPEIENIVTFIENASRNAMLEADKYFLQPNKNDITAVPLKLWWPLLRPVETLKNLTTDVVIEAIGGPDFIKILPISLELKKIIKNRFKGKKC